MSSPFASRTQITLAIESDPPNTVTIRKLTGEEFDLAQDASARWFINQHSTRSWYTRLNRGLTQGRKGLEDVQLDPMLCFDRLTVVKAGIVSWTYALELDAIKDLDDDTLEWLTTEILRLSKPSLFVSAEVAQKETEAPAPRVGGSGAAAA